MVDFIKVGRVTDVPLGEMRRFRVKDQDVCVANVDGKIYAIGDKCSHIGYSLSDGELVGKIVTCPHSNVSSKFDVTTGKLVWRPSDIWIDEGVKDEPKFEVKIVNGEMFISTKPVIGMSKITSEFRVTIPKSVRDKVSFKKGEMLLFFEDEGRLTLTRRTE